MRRLLLLALLIPVLSLSAEIVDVRVDWNNIQCQPDCAKLLDTNFKKIKEVSEVSVSAADGVATLKWKADTKFDYFPIRAAFARVGISMESLRVTVRGTIKSKHKDFYINSLGDETSFKLIGNIQPGQNRFVAPDSPFNRPLSEEQIASFKEAEKLKQTVTITGPILNPNQFPPLDLIIERINISE